MVDYAKRNLFKGSISPSAPETLLPWLNEPNSFFDACTQCGKCVEQCETHIIKRGSGGFPYVDFTSGECTFCYQCADVCPEPLFKSRDASPWDYKADIDEQCLANRNIECRSCSDACEPMAIQFQLTIGHAAIPSIVLNQCNGCGACVSLCPTSSIKVTLSNKEESVYGT